MHEVEAERHLPEPQDRADLEQPSGERASDGDDDESGRAHPGEPPERLTERRGRLDEGTGQPAGHEEQGGDARQDAPLPRTRPLRRPVPEAVESDRDQRADEERREVHGGVDARDATDDHHDRHEGRDRPRPATEQPCKQDRDRQEECEDELPPQRPERVDERVADRREGGLRQEVQRIDARRVRVGDPLTGRHRGLIPRDEEDERRCEQQRSPDRQVEPDEAGGEEARPARATAQQRQRHDEAAQDEEHLHGLGAGEQELEWRLRRDVPGRFRDAAGGEGSRQQRHVVEHHDDAGDTTDSVEGGQSPGGRIHLPDPTWFSWARTQRSSAPQARSSSSSSSSSSSCSSSSGRSPAWRSANRSHSAIRCSMASWNRAVVTPGVVSPK